MTIATMRTQVVSIPLDRSFNAGGLALVRAIGHVLLRVTTTDGVEGLGYVASYDPRVLRAVKSLLDDLAPQLIGLDPFETSAAQGRVRLLAGGAAMTGMVSQAAAAVDMAMWDLKGKLTGLPLWRLLGGSRDRVTTYWSGSLWRDLTLKDLDVAARAAVQDGHRSVKLRLGEEFSLPAEEARVRTVREAVGQDVNVMVDVNQGWMLANAVRFGRMLERYGVYWLEDPIHHQDVRGLAQLAAALDIPICGGEYYWGKEPFVQVLEAGALDIVMIDLLRVGGIGEWMKLAGMLEAFRRPVASHVMPEVLQHCVAASPNGLTVELMPWSLPLFKEGLRLQDGQLVLPARPGLGLELDEAAVKRWSVG